DVGATGLKHLHLNGAAVNRPCHRCPELRVDGIGQAGARGEIRRVEEHADLLAAVKLETYLAFDEGTISNLPHRGVVLLDTTAGFPTRPKATNGYWPLSYRIDLAIGSTQRGEQQGPSLQTLGIAHRGDQHIDMPAGSGKRRQGGRHHGHGSVTSANLCCINGQAHTP